MMRKIQSTRALLHEKARPRPSTLPKHQQQADDGQSPASQHQHSRLQYTLNKHPHQVWQKTLLLHDYDNMLYPFVLGLIPENQRSCLIGHQCQESIPLHLLTSHQGRRKRNKIVSAKALREEETWTGEEGGLRSSCSTEVQKLREQSPQLVVSRLNLQLRPSARSLLRVSR